MKKYNCNVIVCGPTIGKTYISQIDNRFVDEMTNETACNNFYLQNELDQKPTYKIILKQNEYLSDIKNLFI